MPNGLFYVGDEILFDAKATYNGVEYYRVALLPTSFINYYRIFPAELLTTEKVEVPEQEAIYTDVEPNVDTSDQPMTAEDVRQIVGEEVWDNLSEEDKDALLKFYGIKAVSSVNWQADHAEGYYAERNENGGFTIYDPSLTEEDLEKMKRIKIE